MQKTQVRDQDYLRNVQYKDSRNLEARISLHQRFSTNPYNYYLWVFDRLNLKPGERVLEVGCGPGTLWVKNLLRIPDGLDVTLADLSHGMVKQARHNLNGSPHRFTHLAADAQMLPLPGGAFDVVIANHMLHHVPDEEQALSEVRRVLRDGGRFFAATNGQRHMR
jgi:ubiquinone/menaquinone biosynthesis C-methylase UbiE